MKNCCIWLVIYLNCTMMHELTKLNLKEYMVNCLIFIYVVTAIVDLRASIILLLALRFSSIVCT
jgi:hypothetical protein